MALGKGWLQQSAKRTFWQICLKERVSTIFSIVLPNLMVKFHVIQLVNTKFLVQLNIFVEPNYAVLLLLVSFPAHKPILNRKPSLISMDESNRLEPCFLDGRSIVPPPIAEMRPHVAELRDGSHRLETRLLNVRSINPPSITQEHLTLLTQSCCTSVAGAAGPASSSSSLSS